MKKRVSIALVLLLMCYSIVSFAYEPWKGDAGGVYAEQIGKALTYWGQKTGEPLPDLPWQKVGSNPNTLGGLYAYLLYLAGQWGAEQNAANPLQPCICFGCDTPDACSRSICRATAHDPACKACN